MPTKALVSAAALACLLGGAALPALAHAAQGPAPVSSAADRIVLPSTVTPSAYRMSIRPDAKALTFSGKVAIDVTVHSATDTIKLNAAELKFAHVAITGESAEPTVSYDAKQETATLTFAKADRAGQTRPDHRLHGRDQPQRRRPLRSGLRYAGRDEEAGALHPVRELRLPTSASPPGTSRG